MGAAPQGGATAGGPTLSDKGISAIPGVSIFGLPNDSSNLGIDWPAEMPFSDRESQNKRKPARCPQITVSGLTTIRIFLPLPPFVDRYDYRAIHAPRLHHRTGISAGHNDLDGAFRKHRHRPTLSGFA